jgi:hypothetical protein
LTDVGLFRRKSIAEAIERLAEDDDARLLAQHTIELMTLKSVERNDGVIQR